MAPPRSCTSILLVLLCASGCHPAQSVTADDVDGTGDIERPETAGGTPSGQEDGVGPDHGDVPREGLTEEGRFPRCDFPAPAPRNAASRPRCAKAPPWSAERVYPLVDCTGVMSLQWPRAGDIVYIGTDAAGGSCHQTFPLVDHRDDPHPYVADDLGETGHAVSFVGSVGVDLWYMACADLQKLIEEHPGAFDTILADGGSASIGGPLENLSPGLVGALDKLAADDLILDIALRDDSQLPELERLAPKLSGLKVAFIPTDSGPTELDLSKLPEMPCLRLLSLAGGAPIRNVSKLGSYGGLRHLTLDGLLPADEAAALERLGQVQELGLYLEEGSVWPDLSKMKGLKSLRGETSILGQVKGLSKLERLILEYADDDDLVPIGQLSRLKALQIYLGEVSEEGLANLDKLHSLRAIHIGLPETDVDVFAHLGRLKELRTISIFDQSVITDDAMAELTGLQKLERINTLVLLEKAGFNDLAKLRGLVEWPHVAPPDSGPDDFSKVVLPTILKLRNLRIADLSELDVADDDLSRLSRLSKLQSLTLDETAVGDAGAAHLAKLRGLTTLGLAGTKITDAACGNIAKISTLEELDLSGTSVTKACLDQLRTLTSLRLIKLIETGVTEDDARLFEKARPSCQVQLEW